jgi:hypothetical protein
MQLAQLIVSQTSIVDENIRSNSLSQPSFEPDKGPSDLLDQKAISPDAEKVKSDVIEATIELRQLLEGPVKLVLPEASFIPFGVFNPITPFFRAMFGMYKILHGIFLLGPL